MPDVELQDPNPQRVPTPQFVYNGRQAPGSPNGARRADAPQAEAETEAGTAEAKTGPTFWDHISELRKRLLLAFLGVAIAAAIAYAYWKKIWLWLAYPLVHQHLKVDFIATSPLESFITSLKLSLLAGLVMAFPWVMWQFWRFLAPALYARERHLFIGTFFASVLMFMSGAAFAFFVVLPAGLHFLATYTGGSVLQSWKQADYASFISQFLLAFGLIFELPVAVFVLSRLGLMTAKGMWSFFRFAILIIFVVAALLTPGPDPVSQLLLAVPLCLLYLLSIGVAAWAAPREVEA